MASTRAGAEEGLRRGIIRERREKADSVSDKEIIDSAVRGRQRELEGDRCTWVGKDGVVGDGGERERLDWEKSEELVSISEAVFGRFPFSFDPKS